VTATAIPEKGFLWHERFVIEARRGPGCEADEVLLRVTSWGKADAVAAARELMLHSPAVDYCRVTDRAPGKHPLAARAWDVRRGREPKRVIDAEVAP
jgi:hypothetical protein